MKILSILISLVTVLSIVACDSETRSDVDTDRMPAICANGGVKPACLPALVLELAPEILPMPEHVRVILGDRIITNECGEQTYDAWMGNARQKLMGPAWDKEGKLVQVATVKIEDLSQCQDDVTPQVIAAGSFQVTYEPHDPCRCDLGHAVVTSTDR